MQTIRARRIQLSADEKNLKVMAERIKTNRSDANLFAGVDGPAAATWGLRWGSSVWCGPCSHCSVSDRLRVAWNDSEYEIELQFGLAVALTAQLERQ